jgi:hypothetical protein
MSFSLLPVASGVMKGNARVDIDFTKPQEAQAKAIWNRHDLIVCTSDGIGWDGRKGEFCDVQIQTNGSTAVGWSWRTVYAVTVRAEIVPAGHFEFGNGTTIYPAGQFFARYSPDAKNWSSWCALRMDVPKDKSNPKQTYSGLLRVARKEQDPYRQLISEYGKLEVPWKSDEEAAVKWILEKDPQFFQKTIPFIGYVQFLFETSLEGGQRIREIHFELFFGAGGMHSAPKDKEAYAARDVPWRFKAQENSSEAVPK